MDWKVHQADLILGEEALTDEAEAFSE